MKPIRLTVSAQFSRKSSTDKSKTYFVSIDQHISEDKAMLTVSSAGQQVNSLVLKEDELEDFNQFLKDSVTQFKTLVTLNRSFVAATAEKDNPKDQ